MKVDDIRELDVVEINKRICELKKTLFNLRFQHEIDQLDNPKKIFYVRKDIARLKTILTNKIKIN